MKNYIYPVGPKNDLVIHDSLLWADKIICAWGNHGSHLNRAEKIRDMIDMLGVRAYHLGLTKTNIPRHPLYVSYSQKLVRWI